MNEREERIARNEALFRDLNERLKEINESLLAQEDSGMFELFCECGSVDCMEKIRVPQGKYEAVRSRPERFLISPGHDIPEVEDVVERLAALWVVEKHEEEARIVRELDPRS